MKISLLISAFCLLVISCNSYKSKSFAKEPTTGVNDTIRIANDELEYEVIIIEPGFNAWLASRAMPRDYYSQSYLEARNNLWVIEYNSRALQSSRYDPNLYPMQIDYRRGIDYGYEVNYMLYNYLVYFQLTYKQKLGGFQARL
ncbi:DUF6146 family protein [Flavobacterium orientale]|uniref:Lipoprotein n=1 Tax=Flavobacterium orientale TaxID=1756020 RepID=A0A916Y806_9FLAO|nr:DUF6146 family protein [Flavobacterium orientale]GGD33021.1 hypothetical protein GCM10011343_23810 [Flavobacterium orientale]